MQAQAGADPFDSASEYVFLIPPRGREAAKKIDGVDHFDYDGFRPLISGREGIDMLRLRHRLFQQSWNAIESVVENILAEINEKGLAEIANFVNQAYDTNDVEHPGFVSLPFQELPTAVVFAGTNVSDHDHLFGLLYQYLAQASSGQATHRVALLQSKHCATLRGMLKSFMQQIQSDSDNSNSSDEARNSKGGTVSAPTRGGGKPLAHDMQILEGWYSDYERRTHSRPKLVAIVQDFEGFPPAVIEDFISICGQYCDRIPIVLVIGLATSYDTLGQTLSKSGMGRLDIKRFSLQRSNDVIDKVVEKVLVSDCSGVGFMLGYDPYRYLLDQYLLHSYSVTSFLAQLKYATMHHFYANPLSVLHAAMARTKVSFGASVGELGLTEDHIEMIRMLPSVRQRIEKLLPEDPSTSRRVLEDDEYFVKDILPITIGEVEIYRAKYSAGMQIVRIIQEAMDPAQKRPLRTLHLHGLCEDFNQSPYWEVISSTTRRMNRVRMKTSVDKIIGMLSRAMENNVLVQVALERPHATLKLVFRALELADSSAGDPTAVKQILQEIMERRAAQDASGSGDGDHSQTPSVRMRTRRAMSANPFLLYKEEKDPDVTALLEEASGVILNLLKTLLPCYTGVILNEVFWYHSDKLLSMTFSAQPRAAVQVALHQPTYYLGCDCCAPPLKKQETPQPSNFRYNTKMFADQTEDAGAILPTNPDTTIAYRLHQEGGRMINLYDWFMAFTSIVERETADKPDQKAVQARFIHAVDELQYLGFIKPTQRKTDHVLRLTWGMQ